MMDPPLLLPLPDLAATRALGRRLLGWLRPGDVVGLRGGLGAGKTELARAVIRAALGPDEEVPSPTFTLVQTYELEDATLWHYDLYRLEAPDDALELGIEEAFAGGIVLIEWPERLGGWLPAERLDVTLAPTGRGDERTAELAGRGTGWSARMRQFGGPT
ncbi:MAG: tRNA (adenosine(37)-N6)-threonylcarbamoyltransferase complex ATPase subunit type 1 TsaE [Alphaproteobacteria bacterium]|nr:tRNA (adenosine(37)-N6)-threonylcarbamoyltransferase complex ATPase subunit type 1 TsaE [Alphaproteobacteria bacterium]MBF0129595.1 tRNA (adenosine(37)-N6)-threonylcarbamoyltransferase complex ATPase subunit type 1 TsaE [Alphaproteobacteria bacterium]